MESWSTIATLGLVLVSGWFALGGWKRHFEVNQTVEVGPKKQGETRVRRNAKSPEHLTSHIEGENIHTLYDSFIKSCEKYGNRKCFGERKVQPNGELGDFEFISYNEFRKRCELIFQGLCELGVKPKSKIGIFSRNRLEWLVVQSACFMQSNIIVSFYETLGLESLAFVSKHAEIEIAFCSRETLTKTRDISQSHKQLKTIVCLDKVDESEKKEYREKYNVDLYDWNGLMDIGAKANEKHQHVPPQPNDLCTIMYTSGTTGDPKGVMITHQNILSVVAAVKSLANIYENDCHYSYLPYAHILERVVIALAFHYGGSVGIFCGDTTKILTEVKTLKPTIFIGVPRVFERIKAGVLREVAKKSSVQKSLFNFFYKIKYLSILYGFKLPAIEKLMNLIIFNKLKAQLGGRVRVILSGSAPLSLDTEVFLRTCFCDSVVQGYGLTESCGGTAVKLLNDQSLGTLGPPLTGIEMKLVDAPELNYFSDQNCGEVYLRGPSLAIGYYKDAQKTAQDFKDGWFATGDIGRFNKDGSLSIIDRKKNIFKLSQGEYIAVERIEVLLSKCPYVAQICVYGDSTKSCLIAIIHPHQDKAEEWAKSQGLPSSTSFKEICENQHFNKTVLDSVVAEAKKDKLFGFEIPRKLLLIHDPFSDQNDMMTPSFKLKRPQIKQYYDKEIKQLYADVE